MARRFKTKRANIDPLTAAEWNRLVKMVEGMKLSVAPPLRMLSTPNGTALTLAPGFGARSFFIGRIVNDGPGAPGNYADQRYWLKQQKITNSGEADTTDLTWGDETRDDALWVTATNLAEVISGSHDFPDNDNYRVMVYLAWDQTPIARYVFTSLPIVVD